VKEDLYFDNYETDTTSKICLNIFVLKSFFGFFEKKTPGKKAI